MGCCQDKSDQLDPQALSQPPVASFKKGAAASEDQGKAFWHSQRQAKANISSSSSSGCYDQEMRSSDENLQASYGYVHCQKATDSPPIFTFNPEFAPRPARQENRGWKGRPSLKTRQNGLKKKSNNAKAYPPPRLFGHHFQEEDPYEGQDEEERQFFNQRGGYPKKSSGIQTQVIKTHFYKKPQQIPSSSELDLKLNLLSPIYPQKEGSPEESGFYNQDVTDHTRAARGPLVPQAKKARKSRTVQRNFCKEAKGFDFEQILDFDVASSQEASGQLFAGQDSKLEDSTQGLSKQEYQHFLILLQKQDSARQSDKPCRPRWQTD